LLQEASFGPEEIKGLTLAYEATLALLHLKDRTDPVCELIAVKIIKVYREGERDPPRICVRAIRELGIPVPQ